MAGQRATAKRDPATQRSMSSKSDLRRDARVRRAELARACPDFAQRIAAFADRLDIAAHAIVAGYWPVRDEADPRGLMKALGTPLALPRIDAKHKALSFREWREPDALVDNHHGIPEPRADAKIVTPDVVLVPLLAFDAHGHRLGYGGGYFDRTLEALRANRKVLAVGIAYAGQEVAALPAEPHDHALDMIVTETGIRRFTTRPE
jgi:5-formyltetrahydrofolate cyclo-ligase